MRKLEIDLMPATQAQISVDFSGRLREVAVQEQTSVDILLVGFGEDDKEPIPTYLTGGVADAINLKNLQFQNIENVKKISLIVETEIAGNSEVKEYDLSPYNTMDAYQREKITIDGSITARKGTKIYVRFEGIAPLNDGEPSTVLFADLTRHFCC